jgi:hypothetical protein
MIKIKTVRISNYLRLLLKFNEAGGKSQLSFAQWALIGFPIKRKVNTWLVSKKGW